MNNSDSPGSSGNSRPVSMKTMIKIPGSTAEPNTPLAPNQYIGSRMSGMAVTAVLMTSQHTGHHAQADKLGCGVAILGGSESSGGTFHAYRNARGLRGDARSGQTKLVRFPGYQLHLLGNRQRRDQRFRRRRQ
ncbi:Uncharacterised protein [Mycobacterium tuberculosis]|uniref:Uncharacterized protein n=1 Tax=Mycobacterium tuberculosis TaxID=1773 RepID=A0A655JS94_MYCTX|nr:Uncharacterised protein [Mycobacterium tuberculosis]